MKLPRRLAPAAIAGIALASVAGVGYATVPDGGGTIRGCYDNSSGQLRLYDADDNAPRGCSTKETAIAWNQQGPAGPKGDPGAAVAYVTLNPKSPGATDLVDESRSKGVSDANVTHPFDGVWCFRGLGFTPKILVASVDSALSNLSNHISTSVTHAPSCAGGAQAQLGLWNSALHEYPNHRVYAIFE